MSSTPCLICGDLFPTGGGATRCPAHQLPRATYREAARRRQLVADHRGEWGDVCPGWGRDPHPASDLTADHVTPISHGGIEGELRVLCRSCNSRRHNLGT